MSILINGMEMPTSCLSCDFMMNCDDCEGYECYCTVLNRSIGYLPSSSDFLRDGVSFVHSDDRLKDCPLVKLPPHGRLIDADTLMELYADADDLQLANMKVPIAVIRQNIMDMPTIIPASEEGVKTEEDSEPWLCLSCRHYPPSSTDGKPCTQCDPSEVWHSCYDPAEEGE